MPQYGFAHLKSLYTTYQGHGSKYTYTLHVCMKTTILASKFNATDTIHVFFHILNVGKLRLAEKY